MNQPQFRRYGSGCYRYKCDADDGKLKVVLRSNLTFTCFEQGQMLNVSLKQEDWLHEGSIVCPRCEDICGFDLCSDLGTRQDVDETNQRLNEDIKEECTMREDNSIIRDFLQSFQFKL